MALVSGTHWALHRLRRFTTFATIVAVLPTEADCLAVGNLDGHLRLRALLADLEQYRVTWVVGDNPWEPGAGLLDSPGAVGASDLETDAPIDLPRIAHADTRIAMAPVKDTSPPPRTSDFLV